MEKNKPEYKYCWHCLAYTGCDCLLCEEYSEETNENDVNCAIENMIKHTLNMSTEEKHIYELFGLLKESDYWCLKTAADRLGMTIVSLEELGKLLDTTPKYDCKTGKDWEHDSQIAIVEPTGWKSKENYENEKIPWNEYLARRRNSECDYTEFVLGLRRRNSTATFLAGEAKVGDKIFLRSGSKNGKTVTVVDYLDDRTMMKVQVDGADNFSLIAKCNGASLVKNDF